METKRKRSGERVLQISEEIQALVEEAMELVSGVGTPIEIARARSYWLAQIRMAVNEDHGYLGGGGCTMAQTSQDLMIDEDRDDDE